MTFFIPIDLKKTKNFRLHRFSEKIYELRLQVEKLKLIFSFTGTTHEQLHLLVKQMKFVVNIVGIPAKIISLCLVKF